MSAPRRKPPTTSNMVLVPKVEPIRSASVSAADIDEPTPLPAKTPEPLEPSKPVVEEQPEPDTSAVVPVVREAAAHAPTPAAERTPERERPVRRRSAKADEDRTRASNLHVPTELIDKLTDRRQTLGLTTGEVLLVAIEATVDNGTLRDLIHPGKPLGGTLFAARASSRAAALEAGHKVPVNYRLREADFAVIDRLVEEYESPSRNNLLVAALTGFLA